MLLLLRLMKRLGLCSLDHLHCDFCGVHFFLLNGLEECSDLGNLIGSQICVSQLHLKLASFSICHSLRWTKKKVKSEKYLLTWLGTY